MIDFRTLAALCLLPLPLAANAAQLEAPPLGTRPALEAPRDETRRPPPPTIEAYTMPSDLVLRPGGSSYAATRMTVAGLPAGATLGVRDVGAIDAAVHPEPCRYLVRQNVTQTFRAGADGRATLDVEGSVVHAQNGATAALPEGSTGPCRPFMRLVIESAGPARDLTITGRTFRLAPLTVYRIENTWPLRDLLRFALRAESVGVCSGTSLPIGPGDVVPVGVVQVGGDLALSIRSGPFGTACRAAAPPAPVPASARVRAINWDVQRVGTQCDVGDARLPPGLAPYSTVIVPGAIPAEDPDLYCCSPEPSAQILSQLRVIAPGRTAAQHYLNPMHVRLACLPSSSNADGVRVVLRSIVFDGPPNLRIVP